MSPPRTPRPARIVYVHGRPAPHPNRLRLLPSIEARLVPVDWWLPWAQLPHPNRWRKWLSLVGCAVAFPDRGRWDLLIGDGPQHLPVLMKVLGLLRQDQKILPYMGEEFAYFLTTGYYGRRKTRFLRWWFNKWDAYLCLSPLVAELVRGLLPPGRHPDVFTIQNFVPAERLTRLLRVTPDLESRRLVFVGHGPEGFRLHYKGLDLMWAAFARALEQIPGLTWSIVGDWSEEVRRGFARRYPVASPHVRWLGRIAKLDDVLRTHGLYIHCARGEAWGVAVTEAMAAGLPALVSEWTGAKEAVGQVEARLVAPLDAAEIAERIAWYYELPPDSRQELGARSREVVRSSYTEAKAVNVFQSTVSRVLGHLSLSHLELPSRER